MKRDVVVVLTVMLVLLAFNEGLKLVTGTDVPLAIVEGYSMWPTYDNGDVLLIVGVEPLDLKVGDVIVYRKYDGTLVVHRVIDKSYIDGKWVFRTKGDNNPHPDPYPVWEDQVVGRVAGRLIPKVGILFKALMPYKYAIICLLIIAAVILVVWPSSKKEKEKVEILEKREEDKFKNGFK